MRQMHDPAALVLHFHLFLGVATGQKGINVRQDIEGNRMGVDLHDRRLLSGGRFDLRPEFADRACTAAGDSLVMEAKTRRTPNASATDKAP